jgi:hypothetical protein
VPQVGWQVSQRVGHVSQVAQVTHLSQRVRHVAQIRQVPNGDRVWQSSKSRVLTSMQVHPRRMVI